MVFVYRMFYYLMAHCNTRSSLEVSHCIGETYNRLSALVGLVCPYHVMLLYITKDIGYGHNQSVAY